MGSFRFFGKPVVGWVSLGSFRSNDTLFLLVMLFLLRFQPNMRLCVLGVKQCGENLALDLAGAGGGNTTGCHFLC